MDWNLNGQFIGSTWKDKFIRITDPRTNKFCTELPGHEGGRPAKFSWLGNSNYVATLGFSKEHEREIKVWRLDMMSKPVSTTKIDSSSGVIC